jgi:hypothetical protein
MPAAAHTKLTAAAMAQPARIEPISFNCIHSSHKNADGGTCYFKTCPLQIPRDFAASSG